MFRRCVLAATIAAALTVPLVTFPAVAQEPAADCASAFWLEPLAAAAGAEDAAAPPAGDAPAWLSAELADACSGEMFSLAGFAGKTVYVQPMATWCGNCRAQLGRVQEAAAAIPEADRDEIVLVALSSEVDLPREDLARYAADSGFPMIFAVIPAGVLRAMVEDLGQEITAPPATPHFIIAPDGTIGELRTGETSAEDLLALFAAARGAEPA